MLASTASAPRATRCSLGLLWSRDLCSRETGWLIGWLGDVILSRSDSARQRNLMIQDQCPLPVYYSQVKYIGTCVHFIRKWLENILKIRSKKDDSFGYCVTCTCSMNTSIGNG